MDWKSFSPDDKANCHGINFGSNNVNASIPELTGVSYHSDGRTLNSTLWLSKPFEETPVEKHLPIYSMGIGSISDDSSKVKINYVTSIIWYPLNSSWIKLVEEVSNNGERIIQEDDHYKGLFENKSLVRTSSGSKNHVNLSLDLSNVNFPNRYLAVFLVSDITTTTGYDGFTAICRLLDFSDQAVIVPPLLFNIFPSSESIDLVPGQERNILVRVSSNEIPISPAIKLSASSDDKGSLELHFNSTRVIMADGLGFSNLKLKAKHGIEEKQYPVRINAIALLPDLNINAYAIPITSSPKNATQSSAINLTQLGSISEIGTNNTVNALVKSNVAQLSVNVRIPPWSEPFENVWKTYGQLISLVGGGFFAGLAGLFFDRIKEKRKKKNKRIDSN